MVNSKIGIKQYFLPVYYIWAVLSPTLIFWINPVASERIVAFYALFGLIWPLSFVVYPAFLISIRENDTVLDFFGVNIAQPVFFFAWLGPVVHLVISFLRHKSYIQVMEKGEPMTWGTYFSGYL